MPGTPIAALVLDRYMTDTMQQQRVAGISDRLIGASATLGGVQFSNNYVPPQPQGPRRREQGGVVLLEFDPDDPETPVLGLDVAPFPPVANTWKELKRLSREAGGRALTQAIG